jgi:hypothetical protein
MASRNDVQVEGAGSALEMRAEPAEGFQTFNVRSSDHSKDSVTP